MQNYKKATIFIIDDDKISCEILKNSLVKHDFDLIIFNDPIEGFNELTRADKRNCECLILDLLMPKMNGFQFIEKLKKEYPQFFIPIIISSASQDIESIKKALDLGAYDYFTKPLSTDDLNIMLPKKVKNAIQFNRIQKDLMAKNDKMSRDLNLASQFLLKLFPENMGKKFNFYYKYIPYNEIGGDFIDYIEYDDGFIFLIADISGHGVSAALVATFLKAEFRRYFSQNDDIEKFIYYLNSELIKLFHDSFFCTAFIASYLKNEQKLKYINAGHPPPIICINKKPIFLNSTGPLLGILNDVHFEKKVTYIPKGCSMICYTDGIYEFWLEEKNEIFGIKRFYNLVNKIYRSLEEKDNYSIEKLTNILLLSINSFSKMNYSDDLLIFIIEL